MYNNLATLVLCATISLLMIHRLSYTGATNVSCIFLVMCCSYNVFNDASYHCNILLTLYILNFFRRRAIFFGTAFFGPVFFGTAFFGTEFFGTEFFGTESFGTKFFGAEFFRTEW